MSEAPISELKVAITCSRKQYFTRDEAKLILAGIKSQIISDARSAQKGTESPTFGGNPLLEDGAIKLLCDNVHTLAWLKETVQKISVPSCPILEVKSESEVQKRTLGSFTIIDVEGVFTGRDDIMHTLCYQNPGLDFDRFEVVDVSNYKNTWLGGMDWKFQIKFPEDQKRALEKAECRLSIGLTKVDVIFNEETNLPVKNENLYPDYRFFIKSSDRKLLDHVHIRPESTIKVSDKHDN